MKFDYNKALYKIRQITPKQYISATTKIAGRFQTVGEINKKQKVVALIGDLCPHDMNEIQIKFLCDFVGLPGAAVEILPDYDCKNKKHVNGFLKITQPEDLYRIEIGDAGEVYYKTFDSEKAAWEWADSVCVFGQIPVVRFVK